MGAIDRFKMMLGKAWLSFSDPLNGKFDELAAILLEQVAIRKANKLYAIEDVEFYLYHDLHRDIIAYPRKTLPGMWFFHSSGVDISFESDVNMAMNPKGVFKPYLDRNAFFGGILLRGVCEIGSEAERGKITGPLKVADELFDKFDAFGNTGDFPRFVPHSHNTGMAKRKGTRCNMTPKSIEVKVKNILSYNYSGSEIPEKELCKSFEEYINAPYRYGI